MKAEEIKASTLFAGGKQLIVPIWQRRFSAAKPPATHFIGSVVLRAEEWSGEPSKAEQYHIVDGQQRIASLTILLVAVRDRLASLGCEAKASDLTKNLLINSDKAKGHRRRLVLQVIDDPMLRSIVDGTADSQEGAIVDCHRHYAKQVDSLNPDDLSALVNLIQTRLVAVWITLQEGDNAHRVFQTINAGGRPLRQTDLVRSVG